MTENNVIEMFPCVYCKTAIENDSFYCDQCGNELFICETCGLMGKDSWCEYDGGSLKSAKEGIDQQKKITEQKDNTPNTVSNDNYSTIPDLILINKSLGMYIPIKANTILGRNYGEYTAYFQNEKTISGKHLEFLYSEESGWSVRDLGSTNQTRLGNDPNQWRNIPVLDPHKIYNLENYNYILIAGMEFLLKIGDKNSNSTQRI